MLVQEASKDLHSDDCSRCINGSTLLHTASYYGYQNIVKDLLQLRVDVDLRDYKGATPLHRAKDLETMQVCVCVCACMHLLWHIRLIATYIF